MCHEPIEWKTYCCFMYRTHLKSERNRWKPKVRNVRKRVVDILSTGY